MKSLPKKYQIVLALILCIVAIYVTSMVIVNERLSNLEATSRLQIAEQKALLSTIAETTARNGADSVTESIIKDCVSGDRNRFDFLLSRLDQGLTQAELVELEQLFGLCGGFFAERKVVMVARLGREIEVLETQTIRLQDITGTDEAQELQLPQWQRLVEGEQTQSVLFSSLVRLQKEIIDTLLTGKSPTSDEIVAILNEVGETREALLLTKGQTDELRAGLTSL